MIPPEIPGLQLERCAERHFSAALYKRGIIFSESSDEEEEPEKVVVEDAVVESSSHPELENVPLVMATENLAATDTMQQVGSLLY
jgi:hypothetical protein